MVRIKISSRLKPFNGSSKSPGSSRNTSPTPVARKSSSADGNLEVSGLVLKVVAIKARNLAGMDKNGTSDPYLVLTLGDCKNATHSIPKTLNPQWNVTMQMPIVGVNSLLLYGVCWDKDRFGKDYLGEFDLALEEIFSGDQVELEPKWQPLQNKRDKKKRKNISGDVLLQFSIFDSTNPSAQSSQVLQKFHSLLGSIDLSDSNILPLQPKIVAPNLDDVDEEPSDDTDDPAKSETPDKRKKRLRLKGLRRQKDISAYEFSGSGEVVGIVFLEICKVTDLPPERNVTRTSFDMDPFVVASLGKKTLRTRVIRHNLNPVFHEKMIFQVLKHEQTYSFSFTVIDRDKLSGNDFVASSYLPLNEITDTAPEANPDTGLYTLKELRPGPITAQSNKSRFKLPLSRSPSTQDLNKGGRIQKPARTASQANISTISTAPNMLTVPSMSDEPQPSDSGILSIASDETGGDPDLHEFTIPLKLKNAEKWVEKHSPQLFLKAKYVPYPALRQQFWRSMLRQYDSDETGSISRVELTTMLDTLGSTLKDSTIDGWFKRFSRQSENDEVSSDLTFDEAVICLEEKLLEKSNSPGLVGQRRVQIPNSSTAKTHASNLDEGLNGLVISAPEPNESTSQSSQGSDSQSVEEPNLNTEEDNSLDRDILNDKEEEHVVEIRECPICHQPRLNKRSDADIVTHIATCASQDWQRVNNIVMAGFVTSSQAQRKWYSKIVTKISYGGYKLGANSANILVQDRVTGQINEERMSVYVRLGIRLLYKGLKSKEMEKKRIRKLLKGLSIKQGLKYDDPASRAEIQKFIGFHQLDMSEVLLPVEKFNNFNEFFYRKLKPEARPCVAPQNPGIIVSPADCRCVVFNRMEDATTIWVKGREFSIGRLLGNAYPQDVSRYKNAALGIFRLAPQDYHRFHVPVDGIMGEPKTIHGEYYTVNPMAIRSTLDVYGENIRVVIPIDSVAHGRVMVICVGAMMVGSTVITRENGERVSRAEELGYFKFGGSTILVLFEEGTMRFDDDLVDNSITALETLIRVGMSIGHLPTQPQLTSEIHRKDRVFTDRELADAQRRIE